VVLEVERSQSRVVPFEAMTLTIGLDQPELGDPVELARQGLRIALEALKYRFPAIQHTASYVLVPECLKAAFGGVLASKVVELPLQLERGQGVARGELHRGTHRGVARHRADRRYGCCQPEVSTGVEGVLRSSPARAQ